MIINIFSFMLAVLLGIATAEISILREIMRNKDMVAGFYKVPYRSVYCESFWQCVKSMLYCHIWLRIRKPNFGESQCL